MKTKLFVLFLTAALILSACATPAGAATTAAAVGPTATAGVLSTNYTDALPVNSQLALGTIKLKDTPDAVTAEQAATLLPLWEALRGMASATSASQVEFNALVGQIQENMKPSQLQTIAGFKLTQADVQTVMQSMGGFGGGQFGANGGAQRTPGANRGGGAAGGANRGGGAGGPPDGGPGGFGGFPGGGPGGNPGGGAGGNGGATVSPSIQATAKARAAQRSEFGNPIYYGIAVAYLQQLVSPQQPGGQPPAGGRQSTPAAQAAQATATPQK